MDLTSWFNRKNDVWKVKPSKYKGLSPIPGMVFSGNSTKYPIAKPMKKAVNGWKFYTGDHPEGGGSFTLRCTECHNAVIPTIEGKVLHLIQHHNYTREGTIKE